MLGRLALSLLIIGTTIVFALGDGSRCVHAAGTDPLFDTDDDFLPDCVEWAVLTSATNPDTDGDEISDFVEVVQRGTPRQAGSPLPTDQEMRIVVTGPSPGSSGSEVWMHLFVRLVEPTTAIAGFQAWAELPSFPGHRFGLDLLSLGEPVVRARPAGLEGHWIRVSVPLVSSTVLHELLPCSFHVESIVGNRYLRSGVNLFDVQGNISTLVPYGEGYFAVQSIAPDGGGGGLSNRVCLLDLQEIGSGPGGSLFQVVHAFCDDCNEVECAPSCPSSVGWILTIPGGLGFLGSQD